MNGPASPRKGHFVQPTFDALIAQGHAIDVTAHARKHFPIGRVAIDVSVYEQFVAWTHSAMRRHLIFLEETARLNDLLHSASDVQRHDSPAEFVHRSLACDAGTSQAIRHSFVLDGLDSPASPAWLIRQ
jgi:hypothetical protein